MDNNISDSIKSTLESAMLLADECKANTEATNHAPLKSTSNNRHNANGCIDGGVVTNHRSMKNNKPAHSIYHGGVMANLVRHYDWCSTAVGPIDHWPSSILAAVNICLNSRFPMVLWLGDDLQTLYNDAWAPILGKKHPTKLGAPASDTWSEIWHIIGPQLNSVMETGDATWYENTLLPLERNGFTEECYFTYSYSPIFHDDGSIVGVFTSVTETSLQVRGERRLATLKNLGVDTETTKSSDAVYSKILDVLNANKYDFPHCTLAKCNDDGSFSVLNDGAFERQNRDEAWPLEKICTDKTPIHYQHIHETSITFPDGDWGGVLNESYLMPIWGGEQVIAVLICSISPWISFDEKYKSFLELVAAQIENSIATVCSYEQEVERSKKLAEIDRAKTLFFNNVSHEFRTPLTLMLGPLEDAISHIDEGPVSEHLQLVFRNALRLQKLVNTLLDFARIESSRMDVKFESTDLSDYTRDLASAFRCLIEKAGLSFVVDCPPLPENVFIDRDMWEKIVLNLISNAYKFTVEGEIKVGIHWHTDQVKLTVSDTGVGIPEHELPKMFDRFHRIENSESRTHEGTGIGLALVKDLVNFHQGSITVESILGQGSQFIVSLPTGRDHIAEANVIEQASDTQCSRRIHEFINDADGWQSQAVGDAEVVPEQLHSEPLHPDSQTQILIVDDNADMRRYISRILSGFWNIQLAEHGEEACQKIQQAKPDLILSDIMMPKMDGIELLKKLRADSTTKDIPIILLSARSGEESRIAGLNDGADDYLVKPFSAKELKARIQAHLALSKQREQAKLQLIKANDKIANVNSQLALQVKERTHDLEVEKNKLLEVNEKLNEINVSLEQFSHMAAHDLKEPVGRVALLSKLLTDGFGDAIPEGGQKLLRSILQEANSIKQIIADFRQLTQIENSDQITKEPLDLAVIINEVLLEYNTVIAQKNIQVQLQGDLHAQGVRSFVTSLYRNLIKNALDHAGQGVSLLFTGEGNVFGVKNTGSSIPEEMLPKLFRPFTHGAKSSGSGLGLYICKKLMEIQDGIIWVENEPTGVHFKFKFQKD